MQHAGDRDDAPQIDRKARADPDDRRRPAEPRLVAQMVGRDIEHIRIGPGDGAGALADDIDRGCAQGQREKQQDRAAEPAAVPAGQSSEKAQKAAFDFAANEEPEAETLDAGETLEAETAVDLLEETEESVETAGEETSSGAGMADEPAASPDFKTEALWFLEDMGAFLQAAWPWLAGAAVLALSIPGVQKLFNHRKNQ